VVAGRVPSGLTANRTDRCAWLPAYCEKITDRRRNRQICGVGFNELNQGGNAILSRNGIPKIIADYTTNLRRAPTTSPSDLENLRGQGTRGRAGKSGRARPRGPPRIFLEITALLDRKPQAIVREGSARARGWMGRALISNPTRSHVDEPALESRTPRVRGQDERWERSSAIACQGCPPPQFTSPPPRTIVERLTLGPAPDSRRGK